MAGTAGLSMWMSNIAAAAMMLAALRPFSAAESDEDFRRALLVALALGANLGGMATPIGTGPNAIAIAALSRESSITFIGWMAFAFPLTVVMLLVGFLLLAVRHRVFGRFDAPVWSRTSRSSPTGTAP
jgi:sodium-dependent dicarboxylate transporter 2/3/5